MEIIVFLHHNIKYTDQHGLDTKYRYRQVAAIRHIVMVLENIINLFSYVLFMNFGLNKNMTVDEQAHNLPYPISIWS